jgi:hypothetical protein
MREDEMAKRTEKKEGAIPLGQRLMDRPFLLLVLGLAVMALFYTGWGLLEIVRLTPAPLP